MKIDGFDPIKGKPVDRLKSGSPVKGPGFSELLDGLTQSGAPQTRGAVGSIPQMPFVQPPLSTDSKASQAQIVGNLDRVLIDLNMFGNALGNNDVGLQRLQPLADELIAKKGDLASMLASTQDEELKTMVSNTLDLVIDQMNQYQAGYAT